MTQTRREIGTDPVAGIKHRRGFTLIEVILVIALAVVSTGLVVGAGLFSESSLKSRPPEKVLFSAMKSARAFASERGRDMTLKFDSRGFFEITDTETAELVARTFLTPEMAEAARLAMESGTQPDLDSFRNEVSVVFKPVYPELVGKSRVDFPDKPLESVRISPDSTMTPVNVEVRRGYEAISTIKLDPFSGMPLEK